MPQILFPGNSMAIALESALAFTLAGYVLDKKLDVSVVALGGTGVMLWNIYVKSLHSSDVNNPKRSNAAQQAIMKMR